MTILLSNHFFVELTPDDNGTFLITMPSFPEVTSFAETRQDAPKIAQAAFAEALAARMAAGEDVPGFQDFDATGSIVIFRLPLLTFLKVNLYLAAKVKRVTRAELTRRLGWNRNSVDRLFDLNHASRLDQIEAALDALGYDAHATIYSRDPTAEERQQLAERLARIIGDDGDLDYNAPRRRA